MPHDDLNRILGISAQHRPMPTSRQSPIPMDSVERVKHLAGRRYADAYEVANDIVRNGTAIKAVAVIVGVVIIGISAYLAQRLGVNVLVGGGIVAAIAASVLHAVGVMVCAQGQQLLATIDSAVYGSPFLSDDQREVVMSLR